MKIKVFCLIGFFLFSTSIVFAYQEPDWLKIMKSITLLKSTRDDVDKIIGQNANKKAYIEHFDIKGGRLTVIYSMGTCDIKLENGVENQYGWNAPEWIVVDVNFTFEKRKSSKELNLDLSKGFRIELIDDVPDAAHYWDDETGINYFVYKGEIEDISFSLSNKMLEETSCKSKGVSSFKKP